MVVAVTFDFAALTLHVACSDHGDSVEIGEGKVYYEDGVTKEQAQKVGDFLKEQGIFNDEDRRDCQIGKDGEIYVVRFVYEGEEGDEAIEAGFRALIQPLSQATFDGKSTRVELCDENFDCIKEINLQ